MLNNKDLVVADPKILAELREKGGASSAAAPVLPQLRIEHTTDFDGNPNPLKGHFTIATQNMLGKWDKKDLGTEIKVQIILQRCVFNLIKKGVRYSSREFDSESDIITLFQVTGQGEERSATLFAEGTPYDLGKQFLVKDTKGKVRSELITLYVLYMLIDVELVKWRTNMSATFAYRNYQRRITPFAVLTKVTRTEQKQGTNKFYVPKFEAVEALKDFKAVLGKQEELRALLTLGRGPQTQEEIHNEGEPHS